MVGPEYEKKEDRDESGFSEKQLDMALETGKTGVFKKKKIKKTLFEKKSKK